MRKEDIPPEVVPLLEGIGAGSDPDRETPAQRAARVEAMAVREGAIAKREAAWSRKMDPFRGASGKLVEIPADHLCDRCGHASKFHRYMGDPKFTRYGSECVKAEGRSSGSSAITGRALQCPCDGFFPAP